MPIIHKNLATGHFSQMSFCEQMANIGSEVERALNWKERNNDDYSQKAFERALDLIGITMAGITDLSRLKELSRIREVLPGRPARGGRRRIPAPRRRGDRPAHRSVTAVRPAE